MRNYGRILAAAAATPWAIHPEKGRVIADVLTRKAFGEASGALAEDQFEQAFAEHLAAKKERKKKPSATVGVIPIHGTITQRADFFSEWSGGASTDAIALVLDEFVSDPSIDAIVLDVDSPGGTVYGVEELALKIKEATKTKKVIAVANSLMASAAYWLGAQASDLVVTPNGEVGSIGVYLMHRDVSKWMETRGEKVTFVSAGELKVAGHQYGPLDETGLAVLQKGVNDYYDKFVRAVARGRNASLTAVRSGFGKGDVVRAEEAVRENMADRVGTLDDVLGRYGLSTADLRPAAESLQPEVEIRKRKLRMA